MSQQEVSQWLFPTDQKNPVYKMPDYEWVYREMQKSGVTLSLLWVEYCEQCRQNGEPPYKSTQFNKYYADYFTKPKPPCIWSMSPARPCRWTGPARRRRWWTQTPGDAYLVCRGAAIQRLLPHRGFPGYETGGLDHPVMSTLTGISAALPAS